MALQYSYIGLIVILNVFLASCGFQYIDAPPVTDESRWIKQGYSKKDVWRELSKCGYHRPTWSMEQQIAVDKCMLFNEFTFIDSPYGEQGAVCKFTANQNLPSCQSLKNRK